MSLSASYSEAISYKIHKAVFLLDKMADTALHESVDLRLSQFLVLMALEKHPQASQQKIAQFLELTQAAVSRQVEILKDKKLLTRTENKNNRREHILKLTPAGQRLYTKAVPLLDARLAEIFKVMNAAEKESLESSLDKLLSVLCPKSGIADQACD